MAKKRQQVPKEGPAFKAFIDHLAALRKEQFDALVEHTRRAGAAARRRQKVFNSFAKAAGIDLAAISALHAKEWEAVSKPSARQEKAAARLTKLQRNTQRQALTSINKHRDRFEYKKGNPHTSLCRWRATAAPSAVINPQTFNQGLVTIVSAPVGTALVAGENILRTRVRVDSARTSRDPALPLPAAAVDIFTRHTFEATVPHDGVLSVVANYAPAGNIFLGAPGDCIFPGSASAEVVLFMFVEIETAAGDLIELPLGSTSTIIDRSIDATCDSKNRMISVDTQNGVAYQLAHNGVVAVDQGDLVRVRAGIEIFLSTAVGGSAEAVFNTRPFGLNVPMVLIKVDS
jgi:hypothetical protein